VKAQDQLLAFNRGVVSRLALARLDLQKLKFSAEEQTNWMPRALGSMMLRPGLGYLGSVAGVERMIPFIFSAADTALIEMSDGLMRVWVDDQLLTRGATAASITNGTFNTDLTGWADQDQVGTTSAWVAGGYMGLTGDGTNAAIREQMVAASAGLYALRIVVNRGPVRLRVGTSSLGSQLIRDAVLGTGTHSIVVNAMGNFYVQFRNTDARLALVDSIAIEGAGVFTLPTDFDEDDLPNLRYVQSGDVIYIASGHQQVKIERRANASWSIVDYEPVDGPFRVPNVGPITLAASGLTGNITLTASDDLFSSGHVGALFSLTSVGQTVTAALSAANTFTDSVRVTGVGDSRAFAISVSGTFVATVTLQRSFDDTTWADVPSESYTAFTSKSYNDTLDNQIVYYRLGIKTGDYTSGTADLTLVYSSGSRTGVVRITGYSNPTSASAEVVTTLGGASATNDWTEGLWSDYRGWPTSVAIHDGRLWWAGKDRFIGSVSDAFESFDPNYEGDAGPIIRSIGFGPVDTINWLLSLDRLTAGTDSNELTCRSSALDEPLTPTNFTPKKAGTQGTARVQALDIDGRGIFVQRCGARLYELAYGENARDYGEDDLTAIAPEIAGEGGFVGVAVQRQPDTRIHAWRADGKVAVLLFDRAENLVCWVEVETAGVVEDVCVLPGVEEDAVYYVVRRTIDGATVRYLERWAMETEARGDALTKLADSFVTGSGATVSAPHLEGETLAVWADGRDVGTVTISGGTASLGQSYTTWCAGLPYEARFKSTRLAYMVNPGQSALGARKRLGTLALVMADAHAQGIQYGQDFDEMDDLPLVRDGAAIDTDAVYESYEDIPFTIPGHWDTDSRLCLRAASPRPCTVLAAIVDMTTNAKT
jgi:hypothetical protein